MPMTRAEFEKFVAADTEKWGKVIRAANIKPSEADCAAIRAGAGILDRTIGGISA